MIADVNDPAFVAEWMPCSIFDATGRELEFVVWADTETGDVVQLVPGDSGLFELTVDDTGGRVIRRRSSSYPAPLRLVRVDGKSL